MATQAKKSKKKAPDFYKGFVQTIDGVKCLVLPEAQADDFFKKFLEDQDICDDGDDHKDELLKRLFGIECFKIKAVTFAQADVTLEIRAKSKTEAMKIATEKFEGKVVKLDSDNITLKGTFDNQYMLRDVQPKSQ